MHSAIIHTVPWYHAQCHNTHNAQDYFNEVDEATDCEEPKAKTVNLYRLVSAWVLPV